MDTVVSALGWAPLKGCTWLAADSVDLTADGVPGDRLWSPVTHDLRCVKATDVPELAGVLVQPDQLPALDEFLVHPDGQTVRYYDRTFPAMVHEGPVARRLSQAVGQQLWLAHTSASRGFVWSSPVSLLLTSQLARLGLPTDVFRYRPNVVVDDAARPLELAVDSRLRVGDAELVVERHLDRCVVVNHHPVTGAADASLLHRLDPGVLLGLGCTVARPGRVQLGDACQAL